MAWDVELAGLAFSQCETEFPHTVMPPTQIDTL